MKTSLLNEAQTQQHNNTNMGMLTAFLNVQNGVRKKNNTVFRAFYLKKSPLRSKRVNSAVSQMSQMIWITEKSTDSQSRASCLIVTYFCWVHTSSSIQITFLTKRSNTYSISYQVSCSILINRVKTHRLTMFPVRAVELCNTACVDFVCSVLQGAA